SSSQITVTPPWRHLTPIPCSQTFLSQSRDCAALTAPSTFRQTKELSTLLCDVKSRSGSESLGPPSPRLIGRCSIVCAGPGSPASQPFVALLHPQRTTCVWRIEHHAATGSSYNPRQWERHR